MSGKKQFILLSILLACLFCAYTEGEEVRKKIIISGQSGSRDGQIGFKIDGSEGPYEAIPSAIVIDSNQNVYLADIANNRIQKFNSNGEFVSKINMNIKKKRYYKVVDDLAVDKHDNLYSASTHEMKIFKYDSTGNILKTIDLQNKDICWDESKGWHKCKYIQIENINVDIFGSIYLGTSDQIIKFKPNGFVEKKWFLGHYPIYALDEQANLYLLKDEKLLEKFDKNGNSVGTVKCGETLFPYINRTCTYPRFIDKKGFFYFYENRSEGKGVFIKVDKLGNRLSEVPVALSGNTDKFDEDGNFYSFLYEDGKFWIEKYSWK